MEQNEEVVERLVKLAEGLNFSRKALTVMAVGTLYEIAKGDELKVVEALYTYRQKIDNA